MANCPAEAPLADNNTCGPCSSNCVKCNSISECTKCLSQYLLMNGGCVDQCPIYFEPDDSRTNCK